MTSVVVTIFFVGIAALVNVPPGSDVKRMAIFPTALVGQYKDLQLAPHHTYLYLPGSALAASDKKEACENEYKGSWDGTALLCTISLSGALIWTRTSDPLAESETFRKIPSFGALCSDAVDLPEKYTDASMITPDVVAAHVDITGGTANGCRQAKGAFVTRLDVKTDDGALYLRQGGATRRILLATGAVVAIESKEDPMDGPHVPAKHFGWYYYMNRGRIKCDIDIPPEADVPLCPAIPGVVASAARLRPMTSTQQSPDCGNTNYP